jgi:hypothetical protein
MGTTGSNRFVVAALCMLSLVACVDAPTTASDPLTAASENNQLAISFDTLAQEQNAVGDVERAEEFRWAALAARAGVQPARYEVANDDKHEVYSAFVHGVVWLTPTLALRPVGHRTFIAWRKEPELMKVIIISSFTDNAPILHPYSMRLSQPGAPLTSPLLAAQGAYFERGRNGSFWIGVDGQARLAENSAGGSCHPPNDQAPPPGVKCELARYSVGFDMTAALAQTNTRIVATTQARTKHLRAEVQPVTGVKLTFSCIAPTSDRGCN